MNITELVVGSILGVTATELYNYVKRYKTRIDRENVLKQLNRDLLIENEGYLALDHGIPYYEESNIILRDTGQLILINVPYAYREEFQRYRFEIRDTDNSILAELLEPIFEKFNIEDRSNLIQGSVEEASIEFLRDLRDGEMRFNGLMYGVKKIRTERRTDDEKAGLDIDFYKTDYFTYNVLNKIYQKIGKQNFTIERAKDLNFYSPFLSSFGLATFVVVNRGNGDEILIGKRSQSVFVDKGKWHYSMNEAFTIKDIDEYGNPSLTACLFRGIKEELGINELFKKYVDQYFFLDFLMITDRFEVGVSSCIRIKFDKNFTYINLLNLYQIGQDHKLETDSIQLIPVREINSFISENYNDISSACRGSLKLFKTRYDAGLFKNETENE